MKVARLYGPRDVRVTNIDEPEPGFKELKIKVAWSALRPSDLETFFSPHVGFRSWPMPLGHEFSGTIVALGKGLKIEEWSIGTNVVVDPLVSCMVTTKCSACASGHRNRCPKVNFIGRSINTLRQDGGLAEYVTVDPEYVHRLPETVPLDVAACTRSIAIAWHAVKRGNFKKGDSALIMGGGPVVFFILRILRSISGPKSFILVSDISPTRRALALKHGASDVLDPLHTHFGVNGVIYKGTSGFGVNVVFDMIGIQSTIDAALLCLRTGGTFVNMVTWRRNASMNMNFLFKEINVTGAIAYHKDDYAEVIEALSMGRICGIEELFTDRIRIEDVVKRGFQTLLNHGEDHIKILVKPSELTTIPEESEDKPPVQEDTERSEEENSTAGTSEVEAPDQAPQNDSSGTSAIRRTSLSASIRGWRLSAIKTKFVGVMK